MPRERYRLARDVAVNPLPAGSRGSKPGHARQHLIQGDAQGVEVAAGIRSIDSYARSVPETCTQGAPATSCEGSDACCSRSGTGGDAKAGEPDVSGVVDESIGGLQFLMDEALSVDVTERGGQADGNAQRAGQIERPVRLSCSMTRSPGAHPWVAHRGVRSARP